MIYDQIMLLVLQYLHAQNLINWQGSALPSKTNSIYCFATFRLKGIFFYYYMSICINLIFNESVELELLVRKTVLNTRKYHYRSNFSHGGFILYVFLYYIFCWLNGSQIKGGEKCADISFIVAIISDYVSKYTGPEKSRAACLQIHRCTYYSVPLKS